jgi:uncharacterized protein YqhQ
LEGVMMRGPSDWAVAVRRPSGAIYCERHPTSDFQSRHPLFKRPMLRGVFALGDSVSVGARALTISANQALEEEEQLSTKQLGGTLAFALALFVVVFIAAPNFGLAFASGVLGDGLLYHLVEGVVRVALFLGYLAAISFTADIRRVFEYHGAEHATIAAWEHDEVLTPTAVGKYSTLHVRCGTNFLLLVMLTAILVYSVAGSLVPAPDGGVLPTAAYHITLRVVLLPVVAGLAYEFLKLGAARNNWLIRALMRPGLWLQLITTKPYSPDQVEVAIRSLEAVVPDEELVGRTDPGLPSELVGEAATRNTATDEAATGEAATGEGPRASREGSTSCRQRLADGGG